MCEHFAVYTDEEPVAGEPGMEDYEADWWGEHDDVGAIPRGSADPPPGFSDQPASMPPPSEYHTGSTAQYVPQSAQTASMPEVKPSGSRRQSEHPSRSVETTTGCACIEVGGWRALGTRYEASHLVQAG